MGNKVFIGNHGATQDARDNWYDPLNWGNQPPYTIPGPPQPGDTVYVESDVHFDGQNGSSTDITFSSLTIYVVGHTDVYSRGKMHLAATAVIAISNGSANIASLRASSITLDKRSRLEWSFPNSGTLSVGTGTLTNYGIIGSTANGCDISIGTGTLENNGHIVAAHGNTITIDGSPQITGSGTIEIQPSSTLVFPKGARIADTHTLQFANLFGSPGGTLRLDIGGPKTLGASIKGFQSQDVITLMSLFKASLQKSFVQNGETELVVQGSDDDGNSVSFALGFLGLSPLAAFTASSNQLGGTDVKLI